jgi:hypothetical protein
MQAAHEALRSYPDVQFGLLFCESHNTTFYEGIGWHRFSGEVRVNQPGGSIVYDIMETMILPFMTNVPRAGSIDLCGLPW